MDENTNEVEDTVENENIEDTAVDDVVETEEANADITESTENSESPTTVDLSFLDTEEKTTTSSNDAFDPEMYQFALDMVDPNSDFNMVISNTEKELNKANKDIESAGDDWGLRQGWYEKSVKEAEEMSKMTGMDVKTTEKEPEPIEEYKKSLSDRAAELQSQFDKYKSDLGVFQEYVDAFKTDWDNYQKSQPEPEKEKKLVDVMHGIDVELRDFLKEDLKDPVFRRSYEQNLNRAIDEGDAYDTYDSESRRSYAIEFIQGLWNHMVENGVIPEEKANEYRSRVDNYVTGNPDSSEKVLKARQDEAYEKYKNGEITAVEFANVMSSTNKELPALYFSAPKGGVAEAEKMHTPGTEPYESIVSDFKYLNSIATRVNDNYDKVGDVTKSNYQDFLNEVKDTQGFLINESHNTFIDLVQGLVNTGKSMDEILSSDEMKQFSNELFSLSQKSYDTADALEKKAEELGIDQYSNPTKWQEIKATAEAAWNSFVKQQSMTETESYAVMKVMDSLESIKQSAKTVMKSAAFNGAVNQKGGEASEKMKQEFVESISWKDWASTAFWGGLGIVATAFGVATGNPILVGAGVTMTVKEGGSIAKKGFMSGVTREEQMFGAKGKNEGKNITGAEGKNTLINFLNTFDETRKGDWNAIPTYTELVDGTLDTVLGILSTPVNPVAGLSLISQGTKTMMEIPKGGLEGNTKNLRDRIYYFGKLVEGWNKNVNLGIPGEKYLAQVIDDSNTRNGVEKTYGVASNKGNVDSKYSGYRENLPVSNLLDYNYGLEKETHPSTPSDMNIKIYKVYSKEPDYIRKAIGKVLASYKELH